MRYVLPCLLLIAPLWCDVGLLLDWPCPNFRSEQVAAGEDSNLTSWMALLDKELEKHGHHLVPCDLSDAGLQQLRSPSMAAIIFNNGLPSWMGRNLLALLPTLKAKKILITWEPPTVLPSLHDHEFWKSFDTVLTWDTSHLDGQRVIQFCYPEVVPFREPTPPFSKRRLLTQISANKQYYHPNELYSLRRNMNEYFDKHPECDFTFYGYGWDAASHPAFGGAIAVNGKIAMLQNFRFSLCFENTKETTGYITEKIFDCLGAGCVPIYYGAKDISAYIPKGCYIEWEQFGSIEKLYKHLQGVTEEEYLGYLKNIRAFLASDGAKQFTKRALFQKLWSQIEPLVKKPPLEMRPERLELSLGNPN